MPGNELVVGGGALAGAAFAFAVVKWGSRWLRDGEEATIENQAAEIAYYREQLTAARVEAETWRLRYGLLLAWAYRNGYEVPNDLVG